MSKRVAVLITSRQGTERPLPDLAAELSRDGFGAPRWLEDGVACELALPDDLEVVDADRLARRSIGTAAIDVAIVPSMNRRKRLLIADMDSTMISGASLLASACTSSRHARTEWATAPSTWP